MHDYWPFALTILVILAGILLNRQDIRDFRNEVLPRLDRIEADLREFYRTLGQHDARIDNLEKGRTK